MTIQSTLLTQILRNRTTHVLTAEGYCKRLLTSGMQTVVAVVSYSCEIGCGGSASCADSSKCYLGRYRADLGVQIFWDLLQSGDLWIRLLQTPSGLNAQINDENLVGA